METVFNPNIDLLVRRKKNKQEDFLLLTMRPENAKGKLCEDLTCESLNLSDAKYIIKNKKTYDNCLFIKMYNIEGSEASVRYPWLGEVAAIQMMVI